jgi:hypothetical protein
MVLEAGRLKIKNLYLVKVFLLLEILCQVPQ